MDTKNSLLNQFIKIQDLQSELDRKKRQYKSLGKEIRSISQKLPQMIRELNLK